MDGISLLAGAAGLFTLLGAWEGSAHRRRLSRIPIRIHVNGTRGKSSVTRLLAAGLRAGGLRTVAKTTGTLPRLIMPDGSERPIERRGRANVIEQLGVVRRAVDAEAEALVIECMALQPALQSLCELDLVRATHGVVTNARPDHLDVMGPTAHDVALALAGTTPKRGRLFTADRNHLDVFQKACADRRSTLFAVGEREVQDVREEELGRFSYVEHADNVALALRVCESVGVDRATALSGMWEASADPGALTLHEVVHDSGTTLFVNGFAANDPESTAGNWDVVRRRRHQQGTAGVAVVNCRADRTERTEQLADMCKRLPGLDHVVLVGSGTRVFTRRCEQEWEGRTSLLDLADRSVADVADTAVKLGGRSGLVMGMGNVAGPGLELVDWFGRRSIHARSTNWQEAA